MVSDICIENKEYTLVAGLAQALKFALEETKCVEKNVCLRAAYDDQLPLLKKNWRGLNMAF